jgi:hypothetical protein
MKLRELTTRAGQPDTELTDVPADSIRIARLSPIGAPDAGPHSSDIAVEVAPFPAPATEAARRAAAEPPHLRFAVEPPRGARFNTRTAEGLLAVVLSVFALVVLVAASSNGGSHHITHRTAPKLTPEQQCVAAARHARAAAIAKAKRDRGTDAELQDTIPAATPPPCP